MILRIFIFSLLRAQKEIIIRLETLKREQQSSLEPSAPELPDNTANGHQDLWQDAKELVNIEEGMWSHPLTFKKLFPQKIKYEKNENKNSKE